MVNQAIVNDTVKKMLESGIDEQTIVATLQDIGLSEDEAKTIIQRLSVPAPKPQFSPEAQQAVDEVRQMKENILTQNEKQEAHKTETYSRLSEQAEKIDSVERKIGEVHEAVKQMPLNGKDPEMPRRFIEIHTRLDEIMADTKATRELMEKVIEINRKILTELESKR